MIYVDTSVWVALYVNEVHTDRVQHWMASHEVNELASAEWVKTEYASALSVKKRRGDLDDDRFTRAHHGFAEICAGGPCWLEVQTADFLAAAGYCVAADSRLGAGDALHLAVAVRCRCKAVLSLDHVMNDCAPSLGLEVIRP